VLVQIDSPRFFAVRRAVSAQFVPRSGHHSDGATGFLAKAAGQADFVAPVNTGGREICGDWAEVTDWPAYRTTARALVEAVSPYIDPVAVTAMRYWHPMTEEAVDALRKATPLDEIVLLPLYPHFSFATTLSSLKEWRRVYGRSNGNPKVSTVGQFYDHPRYVQAVVQRVGLILRQFADSSRIHLVFSAHGLPMSLVEKGDPYPKQIEETVRLVCKRAPGNILLSGRVPICFAIRARVGPAKWLQPPLREPSNVLVTKA